MLIGWGWVGNANMIHISAKMIPFNTRGLSLHTAENLSGVGIYCRQVFPHNLMMADGFFGPYTRWQAMLFPKRVIDVFTDYFDGNTLHNRFASIFYRDIFVTATERISG
jgi:hypothetical protein